MRINNWFSSKKNSCYFLQGMDVIAFKIHDSMCCSLSLLYKIMNSIVVKLKFQHYRAFRFLHNLKNRRLLLLRRIFCVSQGLVSGLIIFKDLYGRC